MGSATQRMPLSQHSSSSACVDSWWSASDRIGHRAPPGGPAGSRRVGRICPVTQVGRICAVTRVGRVCRAVGGSGARRDRHMDDDLWLWSEGGLGLCSGADQVQQGIQPAALERVERLIDTRARVGDGRFAGRSCTGLLGNDRVRGGGSARGCADRGEEAVRCGAGRDAGAHDQVAGVVVVPAERPTELGELLAVAQRSFRGAVVLAATKRRATAFDLGCGGDPGQVDQLGLDGGVRDPGDGTHLRVRQGTAGEVRVRPPAAHAADGRRGPVRGPRRCPHRSASSASAHTTTPPTRPIPDARRTRRPSSGTRTSRLRAGRRAPACRPPDAPTEPRSCCARRATSTPGPQRPQRALRRRTRRCRRRRRRSGPWSGRVVVVVVIGPPCRTDVRSA